MSIRIDLALRLSEIFARQDFNLCTTFRSSRAVRLVSTAKRKSPELT